MKYLIFSDTHLTDKFDRQKFQFLKKIINAADKIIICGDFYEGALIDIKQLLYSKWGPLLELLKKKEATFIPGNHDPLSGTNLEESFCSEITDKYAFESNGETFIVQHGHRIVPGLAKFEEKFSRSCKRLLIRAILKLEKFVSIKFGWKTPYIFIYRYLDLKSALEYKRKSIESETYLIMAHLHFPYFHEELKYLNTGYIMHGLGSYVTVENGRAELHKEKYL